MHEQHVLINGNVHNKLMWTGYLRYGYHSFFCIS